MDGQGAAVFGSRRGGGGMMSGLGGAMATGMAVGAGASVGREAANYMMGSGRHADNSLPM